MIYLPLCNKNLTIYNKKLKNTNKCADMKNNAIKKDEREYTKMGMSATQARFLCLTARKSNVEFEGQQINQQRTTLSNESANYYSELCNMRVPTPPSVDDYTKVTYTFNDGAMTNTITSMIARGNGQYSISYMKQWQDDYAIVPAASSLVAKTGENYSIGATTLRKINAEYATTEPTDAQVTEFMNENKNDEYIKTLDPDAVRSLLKEEAYYVQLLKLNPTSAAKGTEGWYVRYVKDQTTGAYKPYFYSAKECVNTDNEYGENSGYYNVSCFSLGSATQTEQVFDKIARVEKDTSGRYVSIVIYPTQEDFNNETNGEVYPLTTNTITDEEAYKDAMNQYEFEQAQYDKKIQDINAQLEIVQQQDKKLELNLKQLDTEENAINTEMEAVKKVIQKNVESSFKTFNA